MILVDTSVWIEYFKGNAETLILNDLIDSNTLCINDLILAELIPSINHKKEIELKELLSGITNVKLSINWDEIIFMQTLNLRNGINKVGLPDLIIAQNAIGNNLPLFALDGHFNLIAGLHGLTLFNIRK